MAKDSLDFEAVRAIAREFEDLEEGTTFGSPAIKLGKRLVACMAIHRSAEPGSLVVRTDFEQRADFLKEDPETYYLTAHYENHPVVLVRLARLQREQLRDLLAAGRQFVMRHAAQLEKKRRSPRRKTDGLR